MKLSIVWCNNCVTIVKCLLNTFCTFMCDNFVQLSLIYNLYLTCNSFSDKHFGTEGAISCTSTEGCQERFQDHNIRIELCSEVRRSDSARSRTKEGNDDFILNITT